MLHPQLPARPVLCVTKPSELRGALEKALPGFTLTFAANAYEAIALSNSRPFDAFVLDFWIEDFSGVQLCRHIRKEDPHAPVLIFNATDQDDARKRAMRAGANAVFAAPIDTEAMGSSVARLIDLSDNQSLFAKTAEVQAISEELARQSEMLRNRVEHARQTAGLANERIARAKAYLAFMEHGGTRSQFDRWWPDLYEGYAQRFFSHAELANRGFRAETPAKPRT